MVVMKKRLDEYHKAGEHLSQFSVIKKPFEFNTEFELTAYLTQSIDAAIKKSGLSQKGVIESINATFDSLQKKKFSVSLLYKKMSSTGNGLFNLYQLYEIVYLVGTTDIINSIVRQHKGFCMVEPQQIRDKNIQPESEEFFYRVLKNLIFTIMDYHGMDVPAVCFAINEYLKRSPQAYKAGQSRKPLTAKRFQNMLEQPSKYPIHNYYLCAFQNVFDTFVITELYTSLFLNFRIISNDQFRPEMLKGLNGLLKATKGIEKELRVGW